MESDVDGSLQSAVVDGCKTDEVLKKMSSPISTGRHARMARYKNSY